MDTLPGSALPRHTPALMVSTQTAVTLEPVPAFCVKSKALQDTSIRITASSASPGLKVFVNVAWDANIPPPPEGSEEEISKAMQGQDVDELSPNAWYVPLSVSDARQDRDKAGQPSLVFDCVFNPTIKSRTLKDPEFKTFIIELSFQRIEAQASIVLSRQISTPNIASKGKPQRRTIHISPTLYPPGHANHRSAPVLIEEVAPGQEAVPKIKNKSAKAPKGILKETSPGSSAPLIRTPSWAWNKNETKICVIVTVPGLTHAHIHSSTLDLEPRRIILHIPALYELDINLDTADAELTAIFSKCGSSDSALTLKRMRDLDVDGANAEWRVAEETIVIYA
ncbi:hypothetical protein SERLADRAFT_453038 [Serpula lacrymans var. lacrymans S7.9]|uniref:PIH1 N-terminal domain-containing protein n=1 Tax=Serpula lacrymans var. lacrymans (strain S7.9) TaxID=578457 RepID=F8P9N2_SERL9|nr:uncharacterized protein SERLADRAFT_453038 [Serpula lacrymans var. lacrymans S7.9]EGO20361.1 hypothetical protein SERLADRAFT_453038 [Serpula lacrymans var. lacrymans S7.9]